MIKFNVLGDLKEVELMEHHIQSSNMITKTLRRQVSHSDKMSRGPIVVLDNLRLNRSHVMGKGVTKYLKSLS